MKTEDRETINKKMTTYDCQWNNELALKAQSGNPDAIEELLKYNTGLIKHLAKKYATIKYPYEDLYQDGIIGILSSLSTFDSSKGAFSTHAYFFIDSEMKKMIALNTSDFHQSQRFRLNQNKFRKLELQLLENKNKDYSDSELEEFNLSKLDVENIQKYQKSACLSFEGMIDEGKEMIYQNNPTSLDLRIIESINKETIYQELKQQLSILELDIICKVYGVGKEVMRINQIAQEYSVTKQYISSVKMKAIRKLRNSEELKNILSEMA